MWSPVLVLGEQVAGLVTHYASDLRVMWRILCRLPYYWAFCIADAFDLGTHSNRSRMGIVGVRLDSLLVRPVHHPRDDTPAAYD